jgi:hypothetical protein
VSFEVDISACPEHLALALTNEFKAGHQRELVMARVNQAKVACEERGVTRRSVEGLGRPRLQITGEAYHFWGGKLGYECWSDKQFRNEFERDNPEARIKSTGTRIQSGYGGLGGVARVGKGFHKVYGE